MVQKNTNTNIEFEQIEAVKLVGVWTSFWNTIKQKLFLYIVLPIIFFVPVMFLGIKYHDANSFVLAVFFPFVLYFFIYRSLMEKFMKCFAFRAGFNYEKTAKINSVEGTLFNNKQLPTISEVVSGLYYNHETRFFIFSTVEGSGEYRKIKYYSVLEIKFDMMLPDIVLNNKENFFGSNPLIFVNEKKMKLEGDFDKYFDIYAPDEFEIEVLQIFTPEIMQIFINKTKDFNMEIYKNKVYIYHNSRINNEDGIVSMYDLAKDIIQKLGSIFESMKSDVEAMEKYYKLT